MKTRTWIIIFAVIVLFGVCFYLFYGREGNTAIIYISGEIYRKVDLRFDTEFEITTEWGSNTVKVQGGKIAVVSADCPDKVCVSMGYMDKDGQPVICMPHRLVIEVTGGSIDG